MSESNQQPGRNAHGSPFIGAQILLQQATHIRATDYRAGLTPPHIAV